MKSRQTLFGFVKTSSNSLLSLHAQIDKEITNILMNHEGEKPGVRGGTAEAGGYGSFSTPHNFQNVFKVMPEIRLLLAFSMFSPPKCYNPLNL